MHLSFAVDPGVRAPKDAGALCMPFAVAAQRKQPALPMPMRPHVFFFRAEIHAAGRIIQHFSRYL